MDDFVSYKAALARWSARNNFLIDKWTKALSKLNSEFDELYTYPASLERDKRFSELRAVKSRICQFIDDLKAPAFSDLDFKIDKDFVDVQSKKRVDATQIELLDGDYVRQSF